VESLGLFSVSIMKKILIIPSWYPTKESPYEGTFFREQALLMMNKYNIRILYPRFFKGKFSARLSFFLKTILFIITNIKSDWLIKLDRNESVYTYYCGTHLYKWSTPFFIKNIIHNHYYNKFISEKWKPDLIHAQCSDEAGIIARFLSIKYSIPYIITEHQLFLLHKFSASKRRRIIDAIENSAVMLVVSEHQKRMIMMHGIDCRPIVVGNVVDEDIFKIIKKDHAEFVVLYISYDSYIKDNETFIKAIKLIEYENNIKIMIIGSSFANNTQNPFICILKKYDIKCDVEIIGNVPRDEISDHYNKADVFVSTSIAETFGLSACEALFCGIPVITTSSGGIDDFINSTNGIKVSIGDYKGIAEAIMAVKNKNVTFDPVVIRNSVLGKYCKNTFINKMDSYYSM